jgi:hypothetical protein
MPATDDSETLFGQPVARPAARAAQPAQQHKPAPAPLPDDKALWRWARKVWHEFEAWEAALGTNVELTTAAAHLDEFVRMGILSLREVGHRKFFKVEAKCHVPGLDPDPAPAPAAGKPPAPPMKHEPLPKAPFQPVAGSIAGAHKADETADTRRAQVFAALLHAGVTGMTREEIAKETGIKESTLCGRIAELKESGTVIEPDGLKRPSSAGVNVQVYVLSRFAKHFEPKTGAL